MSSPQLIESLVAEIAKNDFISKTEPGEWDGTTEEIDLGSEEWDLEKLGSLLEEACEKHNLSKEDAIQLATLCHQRIFGMSFDEARAMALEAFSE